MKSKTHKYSTKIYRSLSKKLILILVLMIGLSGFSQRRDQMDERIKSQKIAFITEKLSLTPEESQKFWPIYNAHEAFVEKIKSEDLRPLKIEIRNEGDVSDKRADEILEIFMTANNDMHNAKIKLVDELKRVISSKKIIKLKAAEDQFNRKLLEKLREMRGKRSQQD